MPGLIGDANIDPSYVDTNWYDSIGYQEAPVDPNATPSTQDPGTTGIGQGLGLTIPPYDPFAVDSSGGGTLDFPYCDPADPTCGSVCVPGAIDPLTGDTIASCGTGAPGNYPSGQPCLAGAGPLAPGQQYCPGYGGTPAPGGYSTSGLSGFLSGIGSFLRGFTGYGTPGATGGQCINATTGGPIPCPAGATPGTRVNPTYNSGSGSILGISTGTILLIGVVVLVLVMRRK